MAGDQHQVEARRPASDRRTVSPVVRFARCATRSQNVGDVKINRWARCAALVHVPEARAKMPPMCVGVLLLSFVARRPVALHLAIILVATTCMLATSADATIVVSITTDKEHVIGADSKLVQVDVDGTITPTGRPVCKIHGLGGRIFWAAAGLYAAPDSNFDVARLIAQAYQPSDSGLSLATRIQEPIRDELLAALEQRRSLPGYREDVDRIVLELAVYGFAAKGTPTLDRRKFRVSADPSQVSIAVGRQGCEQCGRRYVVVYMGAAMVIDEFLRAHPNYISETVREIGAVGFVRRMIRMAVVASRNDCGPPIDILRLTPQGARWVQHGRECPD